MVRQAAVTTAPPVPSTIEEVIEAVQPIIDVSPAITMTNVPSAAAISIFYGNHARGHVPAPLLLECELVNQRQKFDQLYQRINEAANNARFNR